MNNINQRGDALMAALAIAETNYESAVQEAKFAQTAGDEFALACARQAAAEAYEDVLCVAHDIAEWADAWKA
jgi:hypothetical protein